MNRKQPLGIQRATPAAASRAASRLADAPMRVADIVREMTGANSIGANKVEKAWRNVQSALNELHQARDVLQLRLQEYLESVDAECTSVRP
jgi:uncharacterized membrane protein YcjF (UPF0283 family)